MRFLVRSLTGLMLLAATLGLIGLAVGTMRRAEEVREAAARRAPPAEERVFAVQVATLAAETAEPVLTAYGDVESARELELRAETEGRLIELAPGFRDGGAISAGETLFRIDPAEAEAELALAETDLAAAEAEQTEAQVGLALAREELAAAERQRILREQALTRAGDLRTRGVGTTADHEAAELALSSAEQVLTGRRLALAEAEARIDRAAIATRRAEIARDEAARDLAATVVEAPFDGVMSEVTAVLGRLVTSGERLGVLIDPTALEVAFRVSNAEFARLAGPDGRLAPLPVAAALALDGIELAVSGRIDRAGAASAAGQTGRLIYAHLDVETPGLLRPGDFVTVRVAEPALQGVAVLPATAVGPDGTILLVAEDARLQATPVRVLRRQGDLVIVADAPFGLTYVTERLPQIGAGVKVRPVAPTTEAEPASGMDAERMVRLSPERRAGLIAAVEANSHLPAAAKARILAALEGDEVPQSMIDRLEARGG